jgi:hypothetical protein
METVNIPEYYTTQELQAMSAEDLREAQANGFRKPDASPLPPAPPQGVRPAAEVWGSSEYDFVCPSGAQCRMRKLVPEKLLEHGILDKVSSLQGIVAEVVDKAEGMPPKAAVLGDMPSKKEFEAVIKVMEVLLPLVVVQPQVYAVPTSDDPAVLPPERIVGRIYTDSIELMDRIAILERAMSGVKMLEPFRSGSSQPV